MISTQHTTTAFSSKSPELAARPWKTCRNSNSFLRKVIAPSAPSRKRQVHICAFQLT